MRQIVSSIFTVLVSLSCVSTPETPENSCVSFAVLDTKVEGIIVYLEPETLVLEILPIDRADVLSAEYRRERIPDSIPAQYYDPSRSHFEKVELLFSADSSEILRRASEDYRLKQLRISRESYESFEGGLMAPLGGGRIDITVSSEEQGRKLVAMLTTPCE